MVVEGHVPPDSSARVDLSQIVQQGREADDPVLRRCLVDGEERM